MNNNITVIDKNGNSIVAEGISCIQFVSSGKKYVLYTLNEIVDNNLTKMYVGELGTNVGELDKITDEEWLHIKTTLNGISHGEINPDIKYIDLNSIPLNIGIPKKLAVKADLIQTLNDKYNMETLNDAQDTAPDTPAIQNAPSAGGFFNSEVVGDSAPATEAAAPAAPTGGESIFEHPMVPDLTAQTVAPAAPETPAAPVTEAPAVAPSAPVAQDPISASVMQAAPVLTPEPTSAPTTPEPITEVMASPSDKVTKEDALKAIETIKQYIMQDGSPLELTPASENIETMSTPVVETPAAPVAPTEPDAPAVPEPTPAQDVPAVPEPTPVVDTPAVPTPEVSAPVAETPAVPTPEVSAPVAEAPAVAPSVPVNDTPAVPIPETNAPVAEAPTAPVATPATPSAPTTPAPMPEANTPAAPQPAAATPTSDNFINMGVDAINDMVAKETPAPVENATAEVGANNLINLDAIQTVPEIPVPEPIPDTPRVSNAYVNSDPSGIPVTLPNNYNAGTTNPNTVLGPGSLPVNNQTN